MNYTIITKADYVPQGGRKDFDPSITIPDQSMTLRDLLDRHSRGMPLGSHVNEPFYDEDGDGVDFDALDIVDQMAYIAQKREDYERIKSQYEANVEASKQEKDRLHKLKISPQTVTEDSTKETDEGKEGSKNGK